MQFHGENTCVFKDSDFLTVVVWAHHLITRSLERRLQNRCPRRRTTLPNHSSQSFSSWKRFCDGFGTILDSKRTSQRGPLRVPGNRQRVPRAFKNVFFQSWALMKPPESMLEPICTPRELIFDNFGMLIGLQN